MDYKLEFFLDNNKIYGSYPDKKIFIKNHKESVIVLKKILERSIITINNFLEK